MKKYDGWCVKNKYGTLLIWTFRDTKKEVKDTVNRWQVLREGNVKIVKVKLVEVEE